MDCSFARILLPLMLLTLTSWPFEFAAVDAATFSTSTTFPTWTPSTLTIGVGDTVDFDIGSSHNCVQTQAAGSCTPLSGGFMSGSSPTDTSFVGTFPHTFNSAGTFYWMCDPHCGDGMKGTVTVVNKCTTTPALASNASFAIGTCSTSGGTEFLAGDTCTLDCAAGLELVEGSLELTCMTDGSWSTTVTGVCKHQPTLSPGVNVTTGTPTSTPAPSQKSAHSHSHSHSQSQPESASGRTGTTILKWSPAILFFLFLVHF